MDLHAIEGRSKTAMLKQHLSECNRVIADLKGRLKERELITIELKKLLREVMFEGDQRRPAAEAYPPNADRENVA